MTRKTAIIACAILVMLTLIVLLIVIPDKTQNDPPSTATSSMVENPCFDLL